MKTVLPRFALALSFATGCTTADALNDLQDGGADSSATMDMRLADGATEDSDGAPPHDAARVTADSSFGDAAFAPDGGDADASVMDAAPRPDIGPDCHDPDEDGYGPGCGRGIDCDPNDRGINPGAFEVCDGADQDCDGRMDEGLIGCCQPGDEEVCPDAVPAGCARLVRRCEANNTWGACVSPDAAIELCNGEDDDCDDIVDEGACGLYALGDDEQAWSLVADADSPFGGEAVQAIVAMDHLRSIWIITATRVHSFDVRRQVWGESRNRAGVFPRLGNQRISGGTSVPRWWANGSETTGVSLNVGNEVHQYRVAEDVAEFVEIVTLDTPAWQSENAPNPNTITSSFIDLANRREAYPGSPQQLCGRGSDTMVPVIAVLASQTLHPVDAGWCFEFAAPFGLAGWELSQLQNAPPLSRALGWSHYDTEEGQLDGHYVIAPLPGH